MKVLMVNVLMVEVLMVLTICPRPDMVVNNKMASGAAH